MDADYKQQLEEKKARLQELLSTYYDGALEVFPSPAEHYRMRAEFRVWHDDDDLYYVMFNQGTREKYRVDSFAPASKIINELMPVLIEKALLSPALKRKLFQVDFLSTSTEEILITLLYHKKLDAEWQQHAEQLKEQLSALGYHINLIGRARKQKILIDRDYVIETLNINGNDIHYQQVENSFTQPNAAIATQMLEWTITQSEHFSGDLLELYCGNGNFSIALSKSFDKILATELAKPSVKSAHHNIELNKISNIAIARLSAEELTEAMQKSRSFNRLHDIDLDSYNFSTILVDPPRSGIDEQTLKMMSAYSNIIYISCNPETLYNNIEFLSKTHEVTKLALFDQFPYTHHIETGVILQKRTIAK